MATGSILHAPVPRGGKGTFGDTPTQVATSEAQKYSEQVFTWKGMPAAFLSSFPSCPGRQNHDRESRLLLLALAVGLCGIVAALDNQVLGPVVVAAAKVRLENGLGARGVALLGIERCARHVRYHGVAATEGVLGGAQNVVPGCGLGEPHVATVAPEVARLERLSNIFLDNDGATGCVDEPRA